MKTMCSWFVLLFLVSVMLSGCAAETSVEKSTNDGAPAGESPSEFPTEPYFRLLALGDFEVFPKPSPDGEPTWTESGTTLHCSGQPRGYLHSKRTYGNFTLRCEYRFVPAEDRTATEDLERSNTGFLIYITGEHKLWPKCLEVQGKHAEMASIKSNSRDVTIEIEDDPDARMQARKPVGEWNEIEIVSKDGALTARLNGTLICQSQPSELTEGAIGLQSEDFAVEFRNLRIRDE